MTFVVHRAVRTLIHRWMTENHDQFKGGYEPSAKWVRSIADEVIAAREHAIVVRENWTDTDDPRGRALSLTGMPLDDALFDQLATTLPVSPLGPHSLGSA